MVATRNKFVVIARIAGSTAKENRFARVEVRALGSQKNIQRQCDSGQIEFDTEAKKFKNIPKDKRHPFSGVEESVNMALFTIRDRTGTAQQSAVVG